MRTLKTLTPGQDGTKELMARFGPSLLWPRKPENLRFRLFGPAPPAMETVLASSDSLQGVRYRYDEDTRERLKTVALVVQRRRERQTERRGSRKPGSHGRRRTVALRIAWQERDLQSRVKSAGGRWDPARRVWMVRRDVTERLELLDRVVGGGA